MLKELAAFVRAAGAKDPPGAGPQKFGTFSGVFTPTLLTILGVIMYLRLGWVVGNGGLLGGLLVIGVALAITTATGLSLSSIATNSRLGAGGPYAIISRSLGLEIGGSVGVPLFLSQALAVTMYIFGFREGWLWVFPSHSPLAVDLVVFGVVFGIAYRSASLAFRIQYLVMAIIGLSLVLVLGSPAGWTGEGTVALWGSFPGAGTPDSAGFWPVFAVFFPAATGIMAGANMSGELKNPRKSIPLGTMAAIGVSTAIYIALAVWSARAASPDELLSNYTVMIDKSLWGPGVLAGLLGATFSSALTSLVGAPRILMALATDRILPRGAWLTRTADNGEPRNAMLVSGCITLGALLVRDLNLIAPLITMFFLITYTVLNAVVLVEGSLGLPSFRPTLRLPRVVSLVGAIGCVFAMFIVNPTFSLIAVGVVSALYASIMRLNLHPDGGDARSGIFGALAEWAAAKATEYQVASPRAWKPSLLVPVPDVEDGRGELDLLLDLARPGGTIKLLGVTTRGDVGAASAHLESMGHALRSNGVFTTWSVIDSASYQTGLVAGLQSLRSAFFRPNLLFLAFDDDRSRDDEVVHLVSESRRLEVGVLLLAAHPTAGMGRREAVHLWLTPPEEGEAVEAGLTRTGQHLAILMAMRVSRAWTVPLRVFAVVETEAERDRARRFLHQLLDLARIPRPCELQVRVGDLWTLPGDGPQSDLDILGWKPDHDLAVARTAVATSRSACLFCQDSGGESALA